MAEALDELSRTPWWAQLVIAAAVAFVIAALVGPAVTERRHRRQFASVADALAPGLSPTDRDAESFSVRAADRTFKFNHQYKGSSAQSMGASYRGPRGHLITIATTINQPAFSMHQFDISRLRLRAHAISGAKRTMSGDGPFDDEFRVIEDGLPGSDRWLNASVRQAVRDLFAALPSNAVVWLQENELTALISTPWPPFDRAALEALLEKQSALARALEHSAARRL